MSFTPVNPDDLLLRNETLYDETTIRGLIALAANVGKAPVHDVVFWVQWKHGGLGSGCAYGGGIRTIKRAHRLVPTPDHRAIYVIRLDIGPNHYAPVDNIHYVKRKEGLVPLPYGGAKSPLVILNSWQEAVCGIAAHELRHIEQYRHEKKPRREAPCEWAAQYALTELRTGDYPTLRGDSTKWDRTSTRTHRSTTWTPCTPSPASVHFKNVTTSTPRSMSNARSTVTGRKP